MSRQGNNVQFEGVDNNHGTGLLTVLIPPIEALETVDVSTSNYEAELGRAGGAVTNIMLKSGTNNLHGAAYWFHADSAIAARETFQPTKPVTTYNSYGFNLGGPIRKNRTFFFGDFLQTKDRRGDGYIISVPTAAFRAGDFSGSLREASSTIRPPGTGTRASGRQPFAGNQIPDARISPIAKKILALVPLPNLGSDMINNYAGSTTRKKDSDSFDVKVDHQQTDKDRFSVRYSFQRPVVTDPGRFGIAGGGGKGFAATGVNRTQSAAINYTRLFSPTFISEARFGLSRYQQHRREPGRRHQCDGGHRHQGREPGPLDQRADLDQRRRLCQSAGRVFRQPALEPRRNELQLRQQLDQAAAQPHHQVRRRHPAAPRGAAADPALAGGARGEFQFGNNQTAIAGSPVLAQVNALASFLLDVPSSCPARPGGHFPSRRSRHRCCSPTFRTSGRRPRS